LAKLCIRRGFKSSAVFILCAAITLFAEPIPQNTGSSSNESSAPQSDSSQAAAPGRTSGASAAEPSIQELPDAPVPQGMAQQSPNESSSKQENQNTVPSGTAAAKAPAVKGTPASRTVGAAIAPAKQKQHRSLLIKTGLVVGAAVAVGSAFALSKGSPSKPPGAP